MEYKFIRGILILFIFLVWVIEKRMEIGFRYLFNREVILVSRDFNR